MSAIANPRFSDVQNMLDAILAKSNYAMQHPPISTHPPLPHRIFWRQTGDYDTDYQKFRTGDVPGVGIPIMNTTAGQELNSNFYVILTNTNGLQDQGIEQMPEGGAFITDVGYQLKLANGSPMTGSEISQTLATWLTTHFPK
jgi:hypothetical protein